ncbi:MAG: hypothetical protein ACJ707_06495, partial [Nitrososphaera sp.]
MIPGEIGTIYIFINNSSFRNVIQESVEPIDSIPTSNANSQKTSEILYGADKAVGRGVQFMQKLREKMDIFFDHKAPSIVIDLNEYRNG